MGGVSICCILGARARGWEDGEHHWVVEGGETSALKQELGMAIAKKSRRSLQVHLRYG